MSKIFGKFLKIFQNDGIVWGAINIFIRTLSTTRSLIISKALGVPGLTISGSPTIRGRRKIIFGKNIHIGGNIWIEAISQYENQCFNPSITIGDNASFSNDVHISCIDKIIIGSNVLMGSHVYIGDHGHGIYSGFNQSLETEPPAIRKLGGGGVVTIGDNVWIGDNAVIIGPLKIGSGSIIGANSVVCRDVDENTIVAGVPAKKIKEFNKKESKWVNYEQ